MNTILQSKIFLSVLFLVVGAGIGNQLPKVSINVLDRHIQEVEQVERTVDADGVPILKDYRRPVVNGKKMGLVAFLTTYCDGLKERNRTCHKVVDYSNRTEG